MQQGTQPAHSVAIEGPSKVNRALILGHPRRCCIPRMKSQEELLFGGIWFLLDVGVKVEHLTLPGCVVVLGAKGVAAQVRDHGWHADAFPFKLVVKRERKAICMPKFGRDVIRL